MEVILEVIVVDIVLWDVVYCGVIDNFYVDYGKKCRVVMEYYLCNVLDEIFVDVEVFFLKIRLVGCFIVYENEE